MTRRAVYLQAGALDCAAGTDIDTVADACLGPEVTPPAWRELDTPLGPVRRPYFPMARRMRLIDRLLPMVDAVLDEAGIDAEQRLRTGVFVGSSSGLLGEQEQDYDAETRERPDPVALRQPYVGALARQLARGAGLGGPVQYFSTACSASANALLYAGWMIREGRLDHALVVGAELENRLSLLGFQGLALLDPVRCRPFDAQRAGVVLGEAAACILLGAQRGAARWQLRGGGTLCDTSHPTSPAPRHIRATLDAALLDAGVAADEIVALKAHGTGTPSNDLAEGQGIVSAFGIPPPVTSIKPVFGHTLGACGVVETLAFLRCLDRGRVPATASCRAPDPETGIRPVSAPLGVRRGAALCSYFGFGGNNSALVFAPC